jgi:hypothetical protein
MSASQVLRIKRGTVNASGNDGGNAILVYRVGSKGKKKKGTRGLGIFEKMLRRSADANKTMASEYLDRHKRSNRKRRDGWVRDLPVNVFRARGKSMKRLQLGRLFS